MQVVHREPEGGDAPHAPVDLPFRQEHDVGDAGGQVDRRGPAQLDDAGTSCHGIGMGATEHQHPTSRQGGRLRRCGDPMNNS